MSAQTGNWVFDVTEAEFPVRVLEASKEQPVAVDFWAPWCGPCSALAPILEGTAEEFRGPFLLARVNTEEAPRLAQQYQIQSIPLVMLFRNGQPVDQFLGLLPESQIRSFFQAHCPTEADRLVSSGKRRMEQRDGQGASRDFRQALEMDPDHSEALLGLAEIAWEEANLEEVHRCLEAMDPLSPQAAAAESLKARAQFLRHCESYGGTHLCQLRTQERPDDLGARYQLGCCLAAEERYQEALEMFLDTVTADRFFKDEAARKAMLQIFTIVGPRAPLADEYRSRLARAIF